MRWVGVCVCVCVCECVCVCGVCVCVWVLVLLLLFVCCVMCVFVLYSGVSQVDCSFECADHPSVIWNCDF